MGSLKGAQEENHIQLVEAQSLQLRILSSLCLREHFSRMFCLREHFFENVQGQKVGDWLLQK